jgi:biopolymer transport protein ExbD
MRSTLITACLLALAQIAIGHSAPSDVNAEVLTIRISADGVCHFLDTSTQCGELADYLLSKNLSRNRHVHIVVDRASKYEMVAAALKSLQKAGFKIGFINEDFVQ